MTWDERRNVKNQSAPSKKIERARITLISTLILPLLNAIFKRMLFHAGQTKKGSREIRDRRTSARKHIAYSHKCTGAISLAFANLLFTGGGRRAARRGGFISVSAQLLTSRNALKRIRRVERNAPARENFYSEPECWAREVALQDAFKFQ
jgi:hypothetical protein